jgi:hypothetical protein
MPSSLDREQQLHSTGDQVPHEHTIALRKGLTVMNEYSCVPAEEEPPSRGVSNPAGADLAHSRPLE